MFGNLMSFENSLWNEFQRLQNDIDSLFGPTMGRTSIRAVARGSFPAINVGVTPEATHVYVFAPGLDMNTLDLSIQSNLLTIAGERKLAPANGGNGFHLRERFSGSFRRVISLPEDVDPDHVSAAYRDGVLTVTIAKREAAKPRQITVTNS